MRDTHKEPWNVYRASAREGHEPHDIVDAIHAGAASFADLKTHFDDWQSAAMFYADCTSGRFQPDPAATECELCGLETETRPLQLLFRALLDQQWGKKALAGILLLVTASLSPIIILASGAAKKGVRLIFPTFHNVCSHCRRSLRFRGMLSSFLGHILEMIRFILLLASFAGCIAIVIIPAWAISYGNIKWGELLIILLICLSPMVALIGIHFLSAFLDRQIRLPQKIRHIAAGPIKYISIKDEQITVPVILED